MPRNMKKIHVFRIEYNRENTDDALYAIEESTDEERLLRQAATRQMRSASSFTQSKFDQYHQDITTFGDAKKKKKR